MKKINSKSYIITLCVIVYFVSYFSRKDFAAVMKGMLDAAVITKYVGGLIGTGLFIAYGVGQLISGYLGDKMKPSKLIIFGLSTTAMCNLLMPLFKDGYAMIIIWALNGLAQAMLWPPIVRLLSENFEHEDYVKGNLIVTSAANVATIILYLYVPLCLKYANWETVFFTASLLAILALVVFIVSMILVLPNNAAKTKKTEIALIQKKEGGYVKLLFRSGTIFIFICIVMMGILRDGIETWLPTLYSEAFHREASEATLLSAMLPIFSILSIMLVTALHKKTFFNNEVLGTLILFISSIIISVPMALLITNTSALARVLCLLFAILICACMHGINFLLISCMPGRFSSYGRVATTSGFSNAFTYVGAALSSYGFAAISEQLGWRATIISWIVVGVLGLLFSTISLKKYSNFIKEDS